MWSLNSSYPSPKYNYSVVILVFAFSLLLAACGGGGNGDGEEDTTAPTTTASVSGGTYNTTQSVTLTCDDGDGSGCDKTYYTTDGSDPTTSSNVYSAAIEISANTTLKYFSTDVDGNSEAIQTQNYVVDSSAPTTTASPGTGNYSQEQSVTLSCDDGEGTGCAATYYTTDGSDPTTDSSSYSAAIPITTTTTLKYFSVDNIGNSEAIKSSSYTFDNIPPIAATTLNSGTYRTGQSATLTCDDDGGSGCANIYYTTDGVDPTTSSTVYPNSPITVNRDMVLKFFATDNAGNNGTIVTRNYMIAPVVSALYPNNGANWNDYVLDNGNDQLSANDDACGVSGGDCIHGGQLRQFEVPDGSCSGFSAQDNVDAFRWRCVEGGGTARFISAGFKSNKSLSSLIDWSGTPVWKQMRVEVRDSLDVLMFTTASSQWWSDVGNPIVEVQASGSVIDLDAAGTVYVITSDMQSNIALTKDKIALVMKPRINNTPRVKLTGLLPATQMVLNAKGGDFLWIEGAINALDHNYGIVIWRSNVVLYDFSVEQAKGEGIRVSGGYGLFYDVMSVNNTEKGIAVNSGNNNRFQNVITSNNGMSGFLVTDIGVSRNYIVNLTSMNNNHGLVLDSYAAANFISNITAVNNVDAGVRLVGSGFTRNTLQNVATVNNETGLDIPGGALSTTSFTFNNVVSANNGWGINIGENPHNAFFGKVKVGTNDALDCQVNAANTDPGITHDSCVPSSPSNFVLSTGVTTQASFMGKVTTDDNKNDSDTDGAAVYDSITDWFSFENIYRSWGIDGSDFPANDHRGKCTTAVGCRIWDWSAAPGDTGDDTNPVLFEVNPKPNGDMRLKHVWNADSQVACDSIKGAVWNDVDSTCTTTYLRNAFERIGDFDGNENGLCESNEICIYTRNIGSYQGHGSTTSVEFDNGVITGVKLRRHENNGR